MKRSRRHPYRQHRSKLPRLAILVVLAILALAAWYAREQYVAPDIVARVLFSETAGCSAHERLLVAGVMHNRIGNRAFGNSASLKAVVTQPGAFSCIGDSDNANWRKSRHPESMKPGERAIWDACVACASALIPPALGPSGRPLVYYHDKSIGMPASWNNAHWHAVREITTEHFVFYSIEPAPSARRWFTVPPH